MQWFQIKEQGAGTKRLILTWYLYKIFGEKALRCIAFIMSLFILIFSPKIRETSAKYLNIIYPYTKIKPNIFNQFKHILSYANSFADKILIFSGNFDVKNIKFENESVKNELFEHINKKQGVFFLCNHVGNVEALQSFFLDKQTNPNFGVNIFLSRTQSKIFNDFLTSIEKKIPV